MVPAPPVATRLPRRPRWRWSPWAALARTAVSHSDVDVLVLLPDNLANADTVRGQVAFIRNCWDARLDWPERAPCRNARTKPPAM